MKKTLLLTILAISFSHAYESDYNRNRESSNPYTLGIGGKYGSSKYFHGGGFTVDGGILYSDKFVFTTAYSLTINKPTLESLERVLSKYAFDGGNNGVEMIRGGSMDFVVGGGHKYLIAEGALLLDWYRTNKDTEFTSDGYWVDGYWIGDNYHSGYYSYGDGGKDSFTSMGFGLGVKSLIPINDYRRVGVGVMARFISETVGLSCKLTFEMNKKPVDTAKPQ